MRTAWLNLRTDLTERIAAFRSGLERLGFTVRPGLTNSPKDGDILVTWNRIHAGDAAAARFIAAGLPVVVTENSTWGNGFQGGKWLFLSRNLHNTAGQVPIGGNERWDSLGVELANWRTGGDETVILAQRGIGSPPVAMPRTWPSDAQRRHGGRIRKHPGNVPHPVPLSDDLANCAKAITWCSGSAIAALMMGIPVISEAPNWVGEQDNTTAGRLAMFRRLAWNQWRLGEIESGEALKWVLC